ncbi:MAG: polyprenyl synthetase family protein [Bacteroidota bacterium]|nr:polyprenyl synthetase family protein [Bacteroidota bacterium]MDP4225408.1 polyprenyl synthetase family protein [Bacteroidota bacterium]MDP4275030.1 polyprenyl synthetase family protein [Bacteroidota bacterium]
MYSFETIQEILSREFSAINWKVDPKELYTPVEYVLSLGGKRIRPSMVLMAYNIFSDDIEKAIKPAIGLEIFHNFTLLHDDIMDKAPIRRNKPTVHTRWNENVAILSGDAMCIKAYEYLGQCEGKYLKPVFDVFTQTALQVCEGQQYDMNFETADTVNIDQYLEMIKLKTSVLLAASLKIGAILGGASEKDADLLYSCGCNFGLSFQLQDDLLDVYGDQDIFGKKIGGDIVANKKTYLLIQALEAATDKEKVELNGLLKDQSIDANTKVARVKAFYDKKNVKAITEAAIGKYFSKAVVDLFTVDVPENKKNELKRIISMMIGREK